MSMLETNFPTENQIKEEKDALKNKGLKPEQVSDIVFVKTLEGLSLEGRLKVLLACMNNDTFRRIRYRKSTK